MAIQGPTLPPHLQAKRKREDERSRSVTTSASSSRSSTPDSDGAKKRRVVGPSLPPASLDERPLQGPSGTKKDNSNDDDDDDSDDDDYGPSLPSASGTNSTAQSVFDAMPKAIAPTKQESKRDEWMTMPPTQDDLAARMDPTKQRAKGFNTGKSANSSSSGPSAMWTETPEERRKRLENEVMGIKPTASSDLEITKDLRKQREDEEKARKIREHNVSLFVERYVAQMSTDISPDEAQSRVVVQAASGHLQGQRGG